jgi:hypothetical protein
MIARRAMIQEALEFSYNVSVDILTNVQGHTSAIRGAEVLWLVSHRNVPDTHPDLENSFEERGGYAVSL